MFKSNFVDLKEFLYKVKIFIKSIPKIWFIKALFVLQKVHHRNIVNVLGYNDVKFL